MTWCRLAITAAAVVALAQGRVADVTLTGRVDTRTRPGTPAATAVVYAEPMSGSVSARPLTVTIRQQNKAFMPRVVGAPAGSSIVFPNGDSIFHNVFSLSSPQPFDLGLYRAGASKTLTFREPAAYYIFCNIHPQMAAFLVVAPTPWITTTAPDGSFRLDLPPGRYRLSALSERAALSSIDVQAGVAAAPIGLTLDESTASTTPHLNKYGKAYPPAAYKDKN